MFHASRQGAIDIIMANRRGTCVHKRSGVSQYHSAYRNTARSCCAKNNLQPQERISIRIVAAIEGWRRLFSAT
jgi:hypothetical protein